MKAKLPDTWRRDRLIDLLEIVIDYRGQSVPKADIGVPLITARNIKEGSLDFSVAEYVEEAAYETWMTRGLPRYGDVVFTTEAPLGNVALYPASGRFALGQRVVGLRPRADRLSASYLVQFLLSPKGMARVQLYATGSTAQGISSQQLKKIAIDYPPLREQHSIAAILHGWDAVIAKVEALTAVKERSLRGLMQHLLHPSHVPQLRLSTFVARVTRKDKTGSGLPLTISGRDGLISQLQFYDKRIAADATEHYTLLKRGEFAYNRSYSSGYPYGAIKRLDSYDEGVVSSLCMCFGLIPDGPVLSDYLVYFCEVGGFNRQIHMIAQEGARNHGLLNVAMHDFFAMKMPVPSLREQARVVNILATATKEIQLLRDELDELRKQKRGLMQKLLRGDRRVGTGRNGARA